MNYSLITLLALFYFFTFLDKYKTRKGILPNAENEANFVMRYAYKYLSRSFQTILEIINIVIITIAVLMLPIFYGLWLLYTLILGSIIGFLSWTKLNKWRGMQMNWNAIFLLLIICFISFGYVLAKIHLICLI